MKFDRRNLDWGYVGWMLWNVFLWCLPTVRGAEWVDWVIAIFTLGYLVAFIISGWIKRD